MKGEIVEYLGAGACFHPHLLGFIPPLPIAGEALARRCQVVAQMVKVDQIVGVVPADVRDPLTAG